MPIFCMTPSCGKLYILFAFIPVSSGIDFSIFPDVCLCLRRTWIRRDIRFCWGRRMLFWCELLRYCKCLFTSSVCVLVCLCVYISTNVLKSEDWGSLVGGTHMQMRFKSSSQMKKEKSRDSFQIDQMYITMVGAWNMSKFEGLRIWPCAVGTSTTASSIWLSAMMLLKYPLEPGRAALSYMCAQRCETWATQTRQKSRKREKGRETELDSWSDLRLEGL